MWNRLYVARVQLLFYNATNSSKYYAQTNWHGSGWFCQWG